MFLFFKSSIGNRGYILENNNIYIVINIINIKIIFGGHKMNKKICMKCGHKWLSKKDAPLACPSCKRYDWNKPNKK